MKTVLIFFIFALSSFVIRDGMGCFPNVLDAEWRLNIFGPKMDRNFKSRFQQGPNQKTEKDFENGEAYDNIEPLDSNQIDITGTLQLPEEEDSLKLKILKIWKGFGYA